MDTAVDERIRVGRPVFSYEQWWQVVLAIEAHQQVSQAFGCHLPTHVGNRFCTLTGRREWPRGGRYDRVVVIDAEEVERLGDQLRISSVDLGRITRKILQDVRGILSTEDGVEIP